MNASRAAILIGLVWYKVRRMLSCKKLRKRGKMETCSGHVKLPFFFFLDILNLFFFIL